MADKIIKICLVTLLLTIALSVAFLCVLIVALPIHFILKISAISFFVFTTIAFGALIYENIYE